MTVFWMQTTSARVLRPAPPWMQPAVSPRKRSTCWLSSISIPPTSPMAPMTRIAEMGEFLQRHPDISIRVEGHTDDSGPAAYNKSLSQRRADAVRTVLIEQYNIDGSRVEAVGVGEEDPIADNSTLPGRKQNRRVGRRSSLNGTGWQT